MHRHSALFRWPSIACFVLVASLLGWAQSIAQTPVGKPAPPRLPHDNLMLYRDAEGAVRPVKSVGDWQKRRAEVLDAMQIVMGKLPGASRRCPLEMKVDETVDEGSYYRKRIRYQSEPGEYVPAFILVPKRLLAEGGGQAPKAPGVLSLHPTNKLGYRVTVGLANYPNAEYGVELAKRGYVVIAPPYPLLSDYNPDLKRLGYDSGAMKAIWDNMRAIDVLESLPFVEKGNIASIGHSLGGHNAIYTAVFDDRIRVAISSCGLDSYRDYMDGKIKGWTSERYMPKLLDYKLADIPFDFHGMLAALAPRHVFISAPKEDHNFRWKSVEKVAASAREVYKLFGVSDRLRVEHPDAKHAFIPEQRQKAYAVIDEALKSTK